MSTMISRPRPSRRPQRHSVFAFAFALEYGTAQQAADALGRFKTVADFAVAEHRDDAAAPHVQGAFACPTARLTLHEAELRLASLQLPPGVLEVIPLAQKEGYGRSPFVCYTRYLEHVEPEHQTRSRTQVPRQSIIVSSPNVWDRVDAWAAVRGRARLRQGLTPPPLSDRATIDALLAYDYVDILVVKEIAPEEYLRHGAAFKRRVGELASSTMPDRLRDRLARPLADDLLRADREYQELWSAVVPLLRRYERVTARVSRDLGISEAEFGPAALRRWCDRHDLLPLAA